MGASTIVLAGVSLNFKVVGTALEATNRNYRVVVPADCVAGYPAEYGDMVIEHTLYHRAVITTSEELCGVWDGRISA